MRYKLISVIFFILAFFTCGSLVAQTCANDPDDPGNCDTLFVDLHQGRCAPNSELIFNVFASHDEPLVGWSIPLKYKNPQTDIILDSIQLTQFPEMTVDTNIDRSAGTFVIIGLGLTGGSIPSGLDTFGILYLRTGPAWDPLIPNPIDTFTVGGPGGQGLSFVDTASNDIQAVYPRPGGCDLVKDDNRFPSALRPNSFILSQNFPNPFNAATVIAFALPHASNVNIEIFNILGQKVRDLADEKVSAGYKKVFWDGKDNYGNIVTSGIYFYRIITDEFVDFKKMTLLK